MILWILFSTKLIYTAFRISLWFSKYFLVRVSRRGAAARGAIERSKCSKWRTSESRDCCGAALRRTDTRLVFTNET
jgi:hypothetical protein